MTFKDKWQKLRPWYKATAVMLLVLVILIAYYLIYVPKPTLEPTAGEGVVYGKMQGSTLRVALISKDKPKAYILRKAKVGSFEELIPAGDYILVYFTKDNNFAKSRISIEGGTSQKIELPKQSLMWLPQTQVRIVNLSEALHSNAIIIPSPGDYSLEDNYTLILGVEQSRTGTTLIDYVLDNWEYLASIGQVQLYTEVWRQVPPNDDTFVEEKWVVLDE